MKLLGMHGVLSHPRQARERQRFITSSLTSSTELSKRLLNSSRSNQKSRPLAMRFHEEWSHADCPVHAWYKQQTQSSTTFTSIQHWRTKKAPFFHEYLLILLDDGAICRVERMGEGSHRNAIKRIGCTAHDIIQWFSASDYDASPISKEPADLVWQINFPRQFDLLDVLAICFSVQRTPRCRPYTLQRYNCYFLCLTILAILARRVGEWEDIVDTEATWSAVIEEVIDSLRQIPCEAADEYMGLGICSLIEPNHSNPRGFILDALQMRLSVRELDRWRASSSAVLWEKELETAARNTLESCIEDAANTAMSSNPNDSHPTNMEFLLEPGAISDQSVSTEFIEIINHEAIQGYFDHLKFAIKSGKTTYQLQKMEYAPPWRYRLLSWGVSWYICLSAIIGGSKVSLREGQKVTPIERIMAQMFKKEFRAMLSQTRLRTLSLMDKDTQTHRPFNLLSGETESEAWIEGSYRAMRSQVCDSASKSLMALKVLGPIWYHNWGQSLQQCICRELNKVLHGRIVNPNPDSKSRTLGMIKASGEIIQLSVLQFHEFIRERIRVHAKRVGSNGLAADQLVEIDIGIAMSEVWGQIPEGHGGRSGQVGEEDELESGWSNWLFPEQD